MASKIRWIFSENSFQPTFNNISLNSCTSSVKFHTVIVPYYVVGKLSGVMAWPNVISFQVYLLFCKSDKNITVTILFPNPISPKPRIPKKIVLTMIKSIQD